MRSRGSGTAHGVGRHGSHKVQSRPVRERPSWKSSRERPGNRHLAKTFLPTIVPSRVTSGAVENRTQRRGTRRPFPCVEIQPLNTGRNSLLQHSLCSYTAKSTHKFCRGAEKKAPPRNSWARRSVVASSNERSSRHLRANEWTCEGNAPFPRKTADIHLP